MKMKELCEIEFNYCEQLKDYDLIRVIFLIYVILFLLLFCFIAKNKKMLSLV